MGVGLLVLGLSLAGPVAAAETPQQPNVLLIYTDDQGTVDVNCYGAKDLATPHLDGLARRGVRFTQMYAPSCLCSPSRAGLMTGRIPPRAGVPSNCPSTPNKPGMPREEVTIADMLAAAGYRTGHVGKWHLGYSTDTMPNAQGFGYSFGHMGGCIDNYSHFFYWRGPNRHDLWRNGEEVWYDGEFFLDLMVDECAKFIENGDDRPFFLYWAINVPHYPLQGTAKWREHYVEMEAPRRMYAEFVSTMDERIGQVLAVLDRLGLREETLVVFQSDHGHSTETRTFGGGGSAGPYRGAKGCFFEGGIRVPAIASMPGTLPEGERRRQLATGCDWLPTLAQLCGARLPEKKLDGKSLVEVIESAEVPSPHEQWYWQLGRGPRSQWAVREGAWKLLGNARDTSNKAPLTSEDKKRFLVNLDDDPSEMENLAEENPEVVERLMELQRAYMNDVDGR
jgi:arylsulfatase A-like enzyme